jgi:hypothetical protein
MADLLHTQNSSNSTMINVKIPDMKVEVIKSILDYIYEVKFSVQPENAVEIFGAAKKFKIEELENHIMENMVRYICFDNFIGFYIATKDDKWKDKTAEVLDFMIG